VEDNYHKDRIANRRLHPETLMMGYGFAPGLSEGSLKPPIFLTSTFVFENAQQGKDFFDLTSGRRQPRRAKNRVWSIRASTIPTSKSLKID
jgi:methionine-gamma-lyase